MCETVTAYIAAQTHARATRLAEKPSSKPGGVGYLISNGIGLQLSPIELRGGHVVMAATCLECYAPYDGTCPKHVYSWQGKLTIREICMCTELSILPGVQSEWSELLPTGYGKTSFKPTDAPRCALCGQVKTSRITALST